MARLIDADRFIKWLDVGHLRSPSEICLSELSVKQMIDLQPTIEAEPVRHGEWKWDENAIDWGLGAWVCSQCHSTNENIHAKKDENPLLWRGSQRCPVCGAKMNGK